MQHSPLFSLLFDPGAVLRDLARADRARTREVRRYLPLLLSLPPLSVAIGSGLFGWRLGTAEPLYLGLGQTVTVGVLYLFALCFGFFSTVSLARWMGVTYGAVGSYRTYLAFFVVVCAPLAVASLAHLFPQAFFNLLVMIPAAIWSTTLLYRGLPLVLHVPPERGMLMSSALVGWLLVAAVSLLGISAALWTAGIGPTIRI